MTIKYGQKMDNYVYTFKKKRRNNMRITVRELETLGACKEAINWMRKQKKRDHTTLFKKALKVSPGWLNWYLTQLFTKPQAVMYSIHAAKQVLNNYEKVYPNDKRPREAIEAAENWVKNPIESAESAAWFAARSARSAAESAAWFAARSAARSAGSAAWSARSAAGSAARSAESAVWSAAGSARSAAGSATRSAAWKDILLYGCHLLGLEIDSK
jgi:hypothetical protein